MISPSPSPRSLCLCVFSSLFSTGHLSSSSIYPVCLAPYLIVTTCSDSRVRFWHCTVEGAEEAGGGSEEEGQAHTGLPLGAVGPAQRRGGQQQRRERVGASRGRVLLLHGPAGRGLQAAAAGTGERGLFVPVFWSKMEQTAYAHMRPHPPSML